MDPDQENVSEAMRRLGLVNSGRLYRNLVGHFSARRYPGRDIYVFLSKSDRDARQVFGDTLGKEHAHIGVAVCQDIANLVKDLATHDEWLGLMRLCSKLSKTTDLFNTHTAFDWCIEVVDFVGHGRPYDEIGTSRHSLCRKI